MATAFYKRIKDAERKESFREKAQIEYMKFQKEQEAEQEREMTEVAWKRRVTESSWVFNSDLLEKQENDRLKREFNDAHSLRKFLRQQRAEEFTKKHKKTLFQRIFGVWETAPPTEKEDTMKDEETIRKEKIAKHMVDMEDRRVRNNFLKENAANIIVLERSAQNLNTFRLPAHHKKVDELPGYSAPPNDGVIERDRLANMTYYTKEKPTSIVENPKDYKSVDQVLREDKESKRFIVAGRHHNYLGVEKLYPLKHKPHTVAALYPQGTPAALVKYPEGELLPNEEEIARQKAEDAARWVTLNEKVPTIRKSHLNMSRNQVQASMLQKTTINDGEPPPVNTQFQWGKRDIVESNSLYGRPHGSLSSVGSLTVETLNSNVTPGPVPARYNLVDKNKYKRANAETDNYNILSSSMHAASSPSTHIAENAGRNGMTTSNILTDTGVRSNFQSMGSIPAELHPVPMQKHRGAKQLDKFVVKEDFNLISRREKVRRQRVQKMTTLADSSGVSIGSNAVGGDGGLRGMSRTGNRIAAAGTG